MCSAESFTSRCKKNNRSSCFRQLVRFVSPIKAAPCLIHVRLSSAVNAADCPPLNHLGEGRRQLSGTPVPQNCGSCELTLTPARCPTLLHCWGRPPSSGLGSAGTRQSPAVAPPPPASSSSRPRPAAAGTCWPPSRRL